MAENSIKSYVWWVLAALLVAVILVGGYFVWSQPNKTSLKNVIKTEAADNTSMQSLNVSAVNSSLTLFSHQLTPGAVLHAPLIHKNKVLLSSTAAKTGERSLVGKALGDGLFLYLNKINSQFGGLGGQFNISLDQRDDGSQLLKGIHELGQLLPRSGLFFSPMGDVPLEKAYVPLLSAHKAAVIFPVTGIRPPLADDAPLYFLRPSYAQEAAALVHYALNMLKKNKIAVFYEESSWGRMGREAVERLLAQHGLGLCAAASYQPGTVNVAAALSHVKRAEPHVVICIAAGRPAYNFIREAMNQKLHYASFLGVSGLAGIADHLRKSRGITLVTSSVVPNPHNSELPIVKEYRQDMQQYLPNKGLSTYSLEGYINSALLTYFLQKLPANATVADLCRLIASAPPMDFKGLSLEQHRNTLSHTIWINEGSQQQWHEYRVKDA